MLAPVLIGTLAPKTVSAANLAAAPIETGGDWGRSSPRAALAVIDRVRDVSLSGVPLVSERQPEFVRVEHQPEGPPHIWLHFDGKPVARIVVDIGGRDWCKLAYQFGHELGHVLANSWGPDAAPRAGCQWLEEALAETFSLRGLRLLAPSWGADPPFPGDGAFAAAIQQYEDNQTRVYEGYAASQRVADDPGGWFRERRAALEASLGVTENCAALVPWLSRELSDDPARVGEIGALNLWPERSGVKLEVYLSKWRERCDALGLRGWLPERLGALLLTG